MTTAETRLTVEKAALQKDNDGYERTLDLLRDRIDTLNTSLDVMVLRSKPRPRPVTNIIKVLDITC
jgi:hypothetical protein